MKLERKISTLFFKFIRNTPLQDRGVSAQDLARELDAHGFIELVSEQRFIELPKLYDPNFKKHFWIVINRTKPLTKDSKMKNIFGMSLVVLALMVSGCASKPQKGFELPIALSEVYRSGALKGMQEADSPVLGMPNQTDRVSHVCNSQPIYTLEGYYIRTDVVCF